MKSKEAKLCLENGVTNVIEVMWANDGITFSQKAEDFFNKKRYLESYVSHVVVDGEVVENPYSS